MKQWEALESLSLGFYVIQSKGLYIHREIGPVLAKMTLPIINVTSIDRRMLAIKVERPGCSLTPPCFAIS